MVFFHVNILKVNGKRAKIEIVSCTTYESRVVCDQYLHKGLKLAAREKTINSINQITNIVHAASNGELTQSRAINLCHKAFILKGSPLIGT